jgi:transposase-like protein
MEAVLRVLRGESLDAVSREIGVTASSLASWRDDFLVGGQANLKSRPADARDDELTRLRGKVGELTMDNELLVERCHRLEGHLPLAVRRSRR